MNRLDETLVTGLRERFLSSPHGRLILKIVLFGSYVKDSARPDSDLDMLLVLSRTDGISDFIADLAIDIHRRYRIGLEAVVVTVDELFPPTSYFLWNVLHYGKEVYSEIR